MTVHAHDLAGCAPEPLAAYLKALAVLRLVAEQRDRGARGWWRGDHFQLATALDSDELVAFFLREYEPTPLVAPWNGGSGFYPKDNKSGIEPIRAGRAARFAPYRDAIARADELTRARDAAPKDDDKSAMIRGCFRRWRGPAADWLSAALVITGGGGPKDIKFPALLGTGGNDGRLDFTNNQMQRLVELLDPATGEPAPDAEAMLRAALFDQPAAVLVGNSPIGQFLPGGAGGANASAGYGGDSLINPWDYVLMLEGAVLLRVAAVRRLGTDELAQAAAPFAVRAQAGGYASASAADESARGEQWMPLWDGPATLAEVRALFAEGRLQAGRKRARRALDAARAVARLGASRGVGAFVRFGYIERNGQANLAVPLGRWRVHNDPHVHLLDEIDDWVARLRRQSRTKGAPASLERDARAIERAMLAVCRGDGGPAEPRPDRWLELLCALGRAEDNLVSRPKSTASLGLRPLPRLSPGWLAAAAATEPDRNRELRLAAALASQHAREGNLGPIRAHCLPLSSKSGWRRFETTAEGLAADRGVVWTGVDLTADLIAIATRRLLDSRRAGCSGFELRGRVFAPLTDVEAFLAGDVDDARLAGLARALMALDWSRRDELVDISERLGMPRGMHSTARDAEPDALYALFRRLYRPAADRDEQLALDPEPLRLLAAGRLADAARLALRRVRLVDGRPKIYRAVGTPALARRIAASLCFPIGSRDQKHLRALLCRPEDAPADNANQTARTES